MPELSDHWRGILTSRSTDDGKTWDEPVIHSRYGHVHEHLLPLPDGRVLMTFAARIGELEGRTYHGIEAVLTGGAVRQSVDQHCLISVEEMRKRVFA